VRSLEFKSWWKELLYNHDKDNDNGYSMMNELKWTLNGFNIEQRISFINNLIADKKLNIAAELIPLFGNNRQKFRIRLILFKNLILSKKPSEYEHLLASVLKTYQPIDYFLVKYYFIINNQFNSLLLKELYNLNQDCF